MSVLGARGIGALPASQVVSSRSPAAVRAKVMTGVITAAMLAGPVGLLIAGPLLEAWGARPVFLLVAVGQLLAVVPFALVAFASNPSTSAPVTS